MTIEEIEKDKEVLAKQIEGMLMHFTRKTGFIPTQIIISQISAFGNNKNIIAGVEIKIEDNSYPAFHT